MHSGIPSVFIVLEKKLFKAFATELSFERTYSFSNKIIFSFVMNLLEKKGLTVLQNVPLTVVLLAFKFPW